MKLSKKPNSTYVDNLEVLHRHKSHHDNTRNYLHLYCRYISNIFLFWCRSCHTHFDQHYCYNHIFGTDLQVYRGYRSNYRHKRHTEYQHNLLDSNKSRHWLMTLKHIHWHMSDLRRLCQDNDKVCNLCRYQVMGHHKSLQCICNTN